jgi:hypothetical protein
MPWVGFEPTIPASERAKAVHGLDRSVTLTGEMLIREVNSQARSTWEYKDENGSCP